MDGKMFAALMLILMGMGGLWYGVINLGSPAHDSTTAEYVDYAQIGKSNSFAIWGGMGAMVVGGILGSRRRKVVQLK